MKIVADENMPLVQEYFGVHGSIVSLVGRSMTAKDVEDADILLVRSVTKVNKDLLEGSQVKFIATATIGTDHLDKKYLEENKIAWSAAPGCNADSVAEYVVGVVAYLKKHRTFNPQGKKAGIVGVGNVGARVRDRLSILGMECVCFDPPKAIRENTFESASLEGLYDCDLICSHAPLVEEGDYPSFHILDKYFFNHLNKSAFVISAGRGPVIDFSVLENLDLTRFFLDVWEPEPNIDLSIMNKVHVATPHVAGYSLQSKWRGTEMVYDAAKKHYSWTEEKKVIQPIESPVLSLKGVQSWEECVLSFYDPIVDTKRTCDALNEAQDVSKAFDLLRKTYPLRNEFSFPELIEYDLPEEDLRILKELGFRFS